MSGTATLNIKLSPRRMLTEREAADYTGVPAKRFPVLVGVRPIDYPDGSRRYDIQDLDRWIDGMKGGAAGGDDDILRKLG